MSTTAPTNFYYPYHVVMDALPRILPTCGFEVTSTDLAAGFITIRGARTVMNAGEWFTVRAGGPDAFHTVVTIESGIRLGVMSWARTQSNFKTIMATLGTYLDQYYAEHKAADAPLPPPPPAAAAPPPPPPAG
jgi:hypothetical protein